MKKAFTLASLLALAAGCQVSAPATRISFNPQTGAISLQSPKQVKAKSISVELPNGAKVLVQDLDSENDAAVLGALAQYQLEQGKQLLQGLDKISALAGAIGAKTATGGIAP